MIASFRWRLWILSVGMATLHLPAWGLQVTAAPTESVETNEEAHFTASATGSGTITYTWDLGDGTRIGPMSSPDVTHTFATPGHYSVIVIAKDDTGVRSDSFVLRVHHPLTDEPPSSSSTIVYDGKTNRVYTANPDHHTVTCLDGTNLEPVWEKDVPGSPTGLSLDSSGTLWVSSDEPAVLVALGSDGEEQGRVEFDYGAHPWGVVAQPDGPRLFVPLRGKSALAVVDGENFELLQQIPVGLYPSGVALSGDGTRLFVSRFLSSSEGGEITEVDVTTLDVRRTFHLGSSPGPDTEATSRGIPNYLRHLLVSPDGRTLWIPSKQDNIERGLVRDETPLTFESSVRSVISKVDLLSNEELLNERIDLNNRALGLSAVSSPHGDYLFVALLGNNGVHAIDTYSGNIVGGRMELGLAPDGLALAADGRLFVHSFLSRTVHVLDVSQVLTSADFSMPEIGQATTTSQEVLTDEVLLGKQVFYNAADLRMGKDGYISCATCHLGGYEDGQVWDFTDRGEGLRNTTSLFGKRGVGQGPLHWSANFDEVQDFEHDIRGPFGGTGFLSEEAFTSGTVNETLGDPKAGLSPELDGMAKYLESLDHVPASPHRDPDGSLSEEAWKGHALFERAGCGDCHAGADFTDSATGVRHDVGTIKESSGSRLGGELDGIDTPTLRGLWQTGPYFHDGSARTLLEVLEIPEDRHGRTSALTQDEKNQLVSYLLQIDNTAYAEEVEPEAPPSANPQGGDSGARQKGGCALRPSSPNRTLWLVLLLGFVIRRFRRTASARLLQTVERC